MEPVFCPDTSENNYQSARRNVPGKLRSTNLSLYLQNIMASDMVCRKIKSQFLIIFSYIFVKLDHICLLGIYYFDILHCPCINKQ